MWRRFSILLRILLPLILLAGVDCRPVSRAVSQNLLRARLAEAQGNLAAAAEALTAVAMRQPYRGLEERIALDYATAGKSEEAVALLAQLEARSALSTAGRRRWAMLLEQNGKSAEAAQVWQILAEDARESDPVRLEARRKLTLYLRGEGLFAEAAAAARGWQALAPDDPAAAFTLALLTAADAPAEAGQWLERAAGLDPAYQPALISLRQAAGQIQLNPSPEYQLAVMGRWLAGQGAWDLAEAAFARAVEANPGYAEAWAFLSQTRAMQKKPGLTALDTALALNPRSALVQALAATYYGGSGDYENATAHMQEAARLEPEQIIWRVDLCNYTAAGGDLVAAEACFAAAQTANPAEPLIWEAGARFSVVYNVNVRDFGLPASRRLIRLAPGQGAGYDLAGLLLLAEGDLRGAERFLQHAIQIEPANPAIHLHLGQLYLELADPERAAYHLRQVLNLAPQSANALTAERLLKQYLGKG